MTIQSISSNLSATLLPPTAQNAGTSPTAPTASTASAAPTAQGMSASDVAASTQAPSTKATSEDADKQLADAVSQVENFTQSLAKDLTFSVDKDSGRTVVKVIDSSTNEVIRQFPSEEMLALSNALDKITGLLIKQKA